MKEIKQITKFLSQKDISLIFSNLKYLKEIRDEDDVFNRSIYIARREDTQFKYLFDKCDDLIFELYNQKLLSHELYFIKYYKGDYIKRHNDDWRSKTSIGRLYTLIIQLTHPNLYSGGETIVYNDTDIKLSKEQGDAIIFPSSTDHELTEVLDGQRFSFVTMFKEDLILKKTLV